MILSDYKQKLGNRIHTELVIISVCMCVRTHMYLRERQRERDGYIERWGHVSTFEWEKGGICGRILKDMQENNGCNFNKKRNDFP